MNFALLHFLSGCLCVAATFNAVTRRGGVRGLRLPLTFVTGGAGLATASLVSGGHVATADEARWYIALIRIGFALVGAGATGIGFALWSRSSKVPVGRITVGIARVFGTAAAAVAFAIPVDQIIRSTVSWHVHWPGVRVFDSAVTGLGTLAVIVGSVRRIRVGTPRGRATAVKVLAVQLGCSVAYFLLRWGADATMLQMLSPLLVAFIGLAYWTMLHRWRFAGVSEDALALLFSNTPAASLVFDLQSERVLTNPSAAALFPAEAHPDTVARQLGLGRNAEDMVCAAHPPSRMRSVQLPGVPGRVFDLSCHFDAGRGIAIVVLSDVTERALHAEKLASALTELRRAQDQLVVQEKSAALGVLVAGVNHEINNPLAYVTANLRCLDRHVRFAQELLATSSAVAADAPGARAELARLTASADAAEFQEDAAATATDALDGCERIRETVASMRMLSRREQFEELLDLSELARAGLKIGRTALSPSISVHADLTPSLPVRGTAGDLSRVVTNLVVNAGQAMGHRGELTVRSFIQEGHAVVEVKDTGPGVPAALRNRIFEPFFTTKSPGEGTGLGLAIAVETMRRHGGELALLESATGARFQLRLPLVEGDAGKVVEPGEPPPVRPGARAKPLAA